MYYGSSLCPIVKATHTSASMHTYIHANIHTYMHANIHTYIHANIHMQEFGIDLSRNLGQVFVLSAVKDELSHESGLDRACIIDRIMCSQAVPKAIQVWDSYVCMNVSACVLQTES